MVVIELAQSSQFQLELQKAGSKPVFVDFFATWCGPCRTIAPVYKSLSDKYLQSVFLKVDVDKLEDIAHMYGVTAMPTFMCFKGGQKVQEKKGADPQGLEEMVKKWAESAESSSSGFDANLPKGQMNINSFIDQTGSECLNESDDHHLKHALNVEGGGYLESDVDEQLIITVAFNQHVRLHSLAITAQGPKAPKTVKLFVNLPNSPDFDSAEGMEPVQLLELGEEDMVEENIINLKFVKFQNVHTITMFVKDNQGSEETTCIDKLMFIGCPVNTTNMGEFKRVAGKKGESH